jgi:Pyridoxamine-phosphate oxidase
MRLILDEGFVFFTNYESVKATENLYSNKASFLYHRKTLRRQNRVRGEVFKEESYLADQYFSERAQESR